MGPFEILWLAVTLFFIMISLARGYLRELGVTTMIFVSLFVITEFGVKYLPRLLHKGYDLFNANLALRTEQHWIAISLSLFLIFVVFASYAGFNTFAFRGKPLTGFAGFVIAVLVGLLNGYLVSGTLWWLQEINAYPVVDLGVLVLPLTTPAEFMAHYLPQYLVPSMFWAVMVMVMLILRVRR
ncbi:MAG TPA: hypothetical protein G4N94_13675 [Caldilineae bacterium]|nr:hypothetical protein [Caldilineae bacterium]